MGESITSGILAQWHVSEGQQVEAGQTLFELETDKVTSEGTAEVAGKISLQAQEGDEVEIGQVIASIDESAQGTPAKKEEDEPKEEASAPKPEEKKPEPKEEPKQEPAPEKKEPAPKKEAAQPAAVSPAVRRVATENGISPAEVSGTGKGGRVTKGDMLKAVEEFRTQAKKTADTPPKEAQEEVSPGRTARTTRRRMSPLRRKIAERLVTAQQEMAMLTTFNEVDMSAVMKLRKQHQDKFVDKHGIKLGFMSFFVKAAVAALQSVPQVNGRVEGEEIVENHYYDIGVAVGTDKGLVVPVVREADKLGFAGIEKAIGDYAKRARDGKITIEDMQGGVFTISNGGIYGSMLSTPIINYPQSAILGLHNIQQRAVVVDGQVVARPMMYLALSYDHRLVDGKEAVTFLIKIKEAIEDPARLLFEL